MLGAWGYGGKVPEQRRARELRAQSWTLPDIAGARRVEVVGVSLGAHVEFVPNPRRHNHWTRENPHPQQVAKLAEIERCRQEGLERIGVLTEREFLVLGLALYAGEGSKTGSDLRFANSDPRLIVVFTTWLRRFFDIDESKFRMRLYLHEGLDVDAATAFWSELTGIRLDQFYKPYRPAADQTMRRSKHVMGCPSVAYHSTTIFRRVMGMIEAVTSSIAFRGSSTG